MGYKGAIVAVLTVVATGCEQDQIRVYTVPKEQSPLSLASNEALAPQPFAMPPRNALSWQTPAGWVELPGVAMRFASFRITGPDDQQAETTIVPLAGTSGDDLSNVNRWRAQVGQPPITAAELQQLAEHIEVDGQPAVLYEVGGEHMRIVAAIVRRGETTWFFKMSGPAGLVAEQKPNFLRLLRTVRFAASEMSSTRKPHRSPPADWQELPAAGSVAARYRVADGAATAEIRALAGDGGGLTAHVNRWRGQLGLTEISGAEVERIVLVRDGIMFAELNGEHVSLLSAIVPQPATTWIYTLVGPPAVVEKQKPAFMEFVHGARD